MIFKVAMTVCLMVMALKPMTAAATVILPDVNVDGRASISDVSTLIDYLLSHAGDETLWSQDRLSADAYGAVGDGVTDDTEALEALFADAAFLGKAAYIPAGTYLIRRPLTLKSGMEVYGDGDNSIIKKIPAAWHKLTDQIKTGVYNDDEDHTITLKVDGISGNVDINVFKGDYQDLMDMTIKTED